jgi:hypothetical protein
LDVEVLTRRELDALRERLVEAEKGREVAEAAVLRAAQTVVRRGVREACVEGPPAWPDHCAIFRFLALYITIEFAKWW